MIRRTCLLVLVLASLVATAEPGADTPAVPAKQPFATIEPSAPKKEDTSLEKFRTPLEALTERTIGTASRAVRFDWRHTRIGFGVTASQVIEYNNFFSGRIGGFVRAPLGPLMAEAAVTAVITWGSDSSNQLALTPYRQFGRPSRAEVDFNLGYPLAEGVATPRFGFLPAAEFVFSVNAGLRYRYYPNSLNQMSVGDVAKSVFAPTLTQKELDHVLDIAPGMQVDPNRYSFLLGFSLDVYFAPGFFFSPRVMIAPSLAPSGSGVGWYWELTFAAGYAL